MNLRLIFCIGMGLFTTYMGLVMLVARFRTPPPSDPPLPRNFSARSAEVIDESTGEKTIYREIVVTTKLIGPAVSVVGAESASIVPPSGGEPSVVEPAPILNLPVSLP